MNFGPGPVWISSSSPSMHFLHLGKAEAVGIVANETRRHRIYFKLAFAAHQVSNRKAAKTDLQNV
jgi:hypothetical protein